MPHAKTGNKMIIKDATNSILAKRLFYAYARSGTGWKLLVSDGSRTIGRLKITNGEISTSAIKRVLK